MVDPVFMDLSKAFNCIHHDLLIDRIEDYSFCENFLTFLYFCIPETSKTIHKH